MKRHMNGKLDLVIFIMSTPEIALTTKRVDPTGGVCCPIAQQNTTSIPKCIRSIPIFKTDGITKGTIINTIGSPCKIQPAIMRTNEVNIRIIDGLLDKFRKISAAI